MYSDKKSILQLVALLKAHGVRKMVLCPGSRNAAIVHTLANIEDFTATPSPTNGARVSLLSDFRFKVEALLRCVALPVRLY